MKFCDVMFLYTEAITLPYPLLESILHYSILLLSCIRKNTSVCVSSVY